MLIALVRAVLVGFIVLGTFAVLLNLTLGIWALVKNMDDFY